MIQQTNGAPNGKKSALAGLLLFSMLLSALTLGLMLSNGLRDFDLTVNRTLQPLRLPTLLTAASWLSSLAAPLTAGALVLVASALLWAKRRRADLLPLWVLALGVPASMEALKAFVARPRPEALAGVVESGASYPSGTTTIATALYGFLAFLLAREIASAAKRRCLIIVVAALVALIAFSRLLLSLHYPSDVAAGLLLGWAWVCLGVCLSVWPTTLESEKA